MLEGLSKRLKESIEKVARSGIVDRDLVDSLVLDIQRSLLSADVNVDLVLRLSDQLKKDAMKPLPSGMSRKEHVIKLVYDELVKVLGEEEKTVSLRSKSILLAGLFGSGKTSTAAKIARYYQKKGLKPLLVACDTVRPAAYDQLRQLADSLDVGFYGEHDQKDSLKILSNALKLGGYDIVIVDSSGRSSLDDSMVREIQSLNSLLSRVSEEYEKILVIPADIGQSAKEQAAGFSSALGITDIVVTKLDATAKGGGALTACHETGAKVLFIARGETPEDLETYDPKKFVSRLLGFSDLSVLLEKAKASVDEKQAKKMIKGDFDLNDFYSQIESMQGVGSMSQILEMAGLGKLTKKAPDLDVQEGKMKKWKHILLSMTPVEKAQPDIINSPRIRRIASGAGVQESDVRILLNNYSKSKKMMKKISPGKLKRGGLGSVFRQFGI